MRKITLLAITLMAISCGLLSAQTNKGRIMIGASSNIGLTGSGSDLMSIGFTTVKEKSDDNAFVEPELEKSFNINLVPRVGYFVADNFAIGLDLNLAFSSNSNEDSDFTFTQTVFSVGPFARYYIPTSTVLPFLEVSGSFGSVKSKIDSGDNSFPTQEDTFNLINFGGGVGLAAPLGEKVTFDVSAGYYSTTIKEKEDNPNNDRSVIGTLGLKIGFTVYLGSN
jgi:hypothetical protein